MSNKEWVDELEKANKKIDFYIKHNKKIECINKSIRNLEICYACLKFIAPYIISAGLCAGTFKASGLGYPFYFDDTKAYQNEMIQYDNYGNNTTQTSYDYFHDINSITIYSPWSYEDNVYKRNISIFNVDNKDIEEVNDVLNGNKNIEDLVKKPYKEIEETRTELSLEEIENDTIIEIKIYNKSKNIYEIRKESISDNFVASILYICAVAVIGAIIYSVQSALNIKIKDIIYNIKCKYKKEEKDVDVLKKKLEIRKDTYERLVK